MKLNLITLAAVLVGAGVFIAFGPAVEWTAVKIAGAMIAGVSLMLLVVARLQLGAAFSVQAKATKLVTTGLYAKIRNPIYVFGALTLVGVAMLLNNWVLLVAVGLLAPVQMMRARKEEHVLAEAFGEEYARYKAGTWF